MSAHDTYDDAAHRILHGTPDEDASKRQKRLRDFVRRFKTAELPEDLTEPLIAKWIFGLKTEEWQELQKEFHLETVF